MKWIRHFLWCCYLLYNPLSLFCSDQFEYDTSNCTKVSFSLLLILLTLTGPRSKSQYCCYVLAQFSYLCYNLTNNGKFSLLFLPARMDKFPNFLQLDSSLKLDLPVAGLDLSSCLYGSCNYKVVRKNIFSLFSLDSLWAPGSCKSCIYCSNDTLFMYWLMAFT